MSRHQTALQVYAFAAVGLFLIVVPWSPVWDSATAPYLPTWAGSWLRSGYVRGAVSGLGGLNLLAAWSDARALLRSLSGGSDAAGPPTQ